MFGRLEQIIVSRPRWPFRIGYEPPTNPTMRKDHQPDPAKADSEHEDLCTVFRDRDVSVVKAPYLDEPAATDDTFWANKALPIPGRSAIILANFLHEERRPETAHAKEFLEPFFDEVIELPPDAIFEGQGDGIWWDEKTLLLGCGVRTNARGVEEVTRALRRFDHRITVVPLEMDPTLEEFNFHTGTKMKFYHLDLCLLPLRKNGTIWIYDMPFSEATVRSLARYARVRRVSRNTAHHMGLNGIEIPQCDCVVVPWCDDMGGACMCGLGMRPTVLDNFHEDGYVPVVVPVSQFWFSGGAAKCLVLELFGSPIPHSDF